MKHITEFLDFAVYLGVEQAMIDRRGRKHPRIVGHFKGQLIHFAFPGTPSDHRSMLNARCALRRKLGLTHSGKMLRQPAKGGA